MHCHILCTLLYIWVLIACHNDYVLMQCMWGECISVVNASSLFWYGRIRRHEHRPGPKDPETPTRVKLRALHLKATSVSVYNDIHSKYYEWALLDRQSWFWHISHPHRHRQCPLSVRAWNLAYEHSPGAHFTWKKCVRSQHFKQNMLKKRKHHFKS